MTFMRKLMILIFTLHIPAPLHSMEEKPHQIFINGEPIAKLIKENRMVTSKGYDYETEGSLIQTPDTRMDWEVTFSYELPLLTQKDIKGYFIKMMTQNNQTDVTYKPHELKGNVCFDPEQVIGGPLLLDEVVRMQKEDKIHVMKNTIPLQMYGDRGVNYCTSKFRMQGGGNYVASRAQINIKAQKQTFEGVLFHTPTGVFLSPKSKENALIQEIVIHPLEFIYPREKDRVLTQSRTALVTGTIDFDTAIIDLDVQSASVLINFNTSYITPLLEEYEKQLEEEKKQRELKKKKQEKSSQNLFAQNLAKAFRSGVSLSEEKPSTQNKKTDGVNTNETSTTHETTKFTETLKISPMVVHLENGMIATRFASGGVQLAGSYTLSGCKVSLGGKQSDEEFIDALRNISPIISLQYL